MVALAGQLDRRAYAWESGDILACWKVLTPSLGSKFSTGQVRVSLPPAQREPQEAEVQSLGWFGNSTFPKQVLVQGLGTQAWRARVTEGAGGSVH